MSANTRIPSPDQLEKVDSWGMQTSCISSVFRPSLPEQISDIFQTALAAQQNIALRGAGCSYGDASLNAENIILDFTRMNRILAWNPQTGEITVEPGVTLEQLWKYCIGDGWWPPVVSGTMRVTMGGAAGMNYHGKNNFKAGPVGDHILKFQLLLPTGELLHCSREENSDIFFAAIGGFGMLGCFTSITMQMKKIYSGMLEVYAFATNNFAHIIQEFEKRIPQADYLVGWIDCFAKGKELGRGQVHEAHYLQQGEDPFAMQTLRIEKQELPDSLFGILPKSIIWRLMKPIAHPVGIQLLNMLKYKASATLGNHKTIHQSHAAFAFLLDYVPNWKNAYLPGGLIQYQSFIPEQNAEECFKAQIELCQRRKMVPWLGVFKKHRKDDFLMSHAVNGYSLALDLRVTERNREALWQMAQDLNKIVLAYGGRFYFAKDSTLTSTDAEAFLGRDAIEKFESIKRRCDPHNLLQSNLSRRLFPLLNVVETVQPHVSETAL